MSKIHIKMMSETAYQHLKKNINYITELIMNNNTNEWIYEEFENPIFIEKSFEIDDFDLILNEESNDKEIDFNNSITLYEHLNQLPVYILTDDKFWLWLQLEKFYSFAKCNMKINGISTVKDHWIGGNRRGLFFGVMSRMYFRVDLSVDNKSEDKYKLTKWVIENPLRFRNLTWRSFSSQRHLVLGILKGEKRALEELGYENNETYEVISKYISYIGSVKLLDVISEEDIENDVYNKIIEINKKD